MQNASEQLSLLVDDLYNLLTTMAQALSRCLDVVFNALTQAGAAAATPFLAAPQPYVVSGTKELPAVLASTAAAPLAEMPAEVARHNDYSLLFLATIIALAVFAAATWRLFRRPASAPAVATPSPPAVRPAPPAAASGANAAAPVNH